MPNAFGGRTVDSFKAASLQSAPALDTRCWLRDFASATALEVMSTVSQNGGGIGYAAVRATCIRRC
eukprot:6203094-Pleurochrysis_carterae.AAC.4